MRVVTRVVLGTVGAAVLVALATSDTLWTLWSVPASRAYRERLTTRLEALDLAEQSLKAAPVPYGWDAAVYLGRDALDRVVQTLVGTEIVRADGSDRGLKITVTDIRLQPSAGALEATLSARAVSGSTALDVTISANVSVVGFNRSGLDPKMPAQAVLRIEPTEFAPSGNIGGFHFALRGGWARLLPDLTSALATPSLLEVSVALPDSFDANIKVDTKGKQSTGTSGSIDWKISNPGATVTERVAYAAPIFTEHGLWLLARRSQNGQPTIVPSMGTALKAAASLTPTEISGRIDQSMARIGSALAGLDGSAADVRAYVSSRSLMTVVSDLQALPPDKVTFGITVASEDGQLAKKSWQIDPLGGGEVLVDISEVKNALLTLKPTIVSSSWTDGGARLDVQVTASGSAPLHGVVRPIGNASVGTVVKVEASSTAHVAGSATPFLAGSAADKIAALLIRPECDVIRLDVATDGRLSFGWGWLNVPRVGVRVGIPIGRFPIAPIRLLDGRPVMVWPLQPSEAPTKSEAWKAVLPFAAMTMSLAPKDIRSDAHGISMSADLGVSTKPRGGTAQADSATVAAVEAAAARDASS